MRLYRYILLFFALLFSVLSFAGTKYTVTVGDASDLENKFNSLGGGDTLYIPNGTYDLSSSDLYLAQINDEIVVMGESVDLTILDFNSRYGFYLEGVLCKFQDLTIKNATDGAIYALSITVGSGRNKTTYNSTINLSNVHFISCTGSALYCESGANVEYIVDCTFEGNSNSADGGALYVYSSDYDVSIENCVFDGNTCNSKGGAIYFHDLLSSLSVVDCVFTGNISTASGSALYAIVNSSVDVQNSLFYDNSGTNTLFFSESGSAGALSILNVTISNNSGRGLELYSAFSGYTKTINNSALTDNTASDFVVNNTGVVFLGNNNIIEQKTSYLTVSGTHNTIDESASYFEISSDSLVHTSYGFASTFAKVEYNASTPVTDVYGVTRDTILSDIGAFEFPLDTVAFWTGGAANKSWSDPGNWKGFQKPEVSGASVSPYTDIYLTYCETTNYPVIGSGINLTNKGRFDNAEIIVADTAIFKNEGTIKVKGITVESTYRAGDTAVVNGQYITTGNIIVSGRQTYEQVLIPGQWNFLGIPRDITADDLLPSHTFGGAWTDSGDAGEYWISFYNDTTRADVGGLIWEQITGGSDILEAGRGYLVWVDDALTVEFDSVPGLKEIPLKYYKGTRDTVHWGWNLLANPYAIALDADAVIANSNNGANTIGGLYWHNGTSYKSRTAEGIGDAEYIPAHQAFFVQADTGLNYQLQTSNAVFRDDVVFKSASASTSNIMKVALRDNESHLYNTYLQIKEGTTDHFDKRSDAYEIEDMSSAKAIIYSELKGVKYSVNTTPFDGDVKAIPLMLKIGTSVSYFDLSFEVEGYDDVNVYLFDKISGERIRIYDNDTIRIKRIGPVSTYEKRYEIEYRSGDIVTSDEVENRKEELTFALKSYHTYFEVWGAKNIPMTVMLYDLLGKPVVQKTMPGGYGTVSGLDQGVYIVKLTQGLKTESRKVLID